MAINLERPGVGFTAEERNKRIRNQEKIEQEFTAVSLSNEESIEFIKNEALSMVVDSAALIWQEPVQTFVDLANTYPVATEGYTAMTKVDGAVYRFTDSMWKQIQQIDAGPVNELDTRLTGELAVTNQELKDLENNMPQVREVYNNGSNELDLFAFNYLSKFEIRKNKTVLSKIVIDVLTEKAGTMVELVIFDKNFDKVISSDKQEIVSKGKNEFALPYKELNVGSYYFGISTFGTNNLQTIRGDTKAGYILNRSYPFVASASTVYEYHMSPYFELYSYDVPEPVGYSFQNRTQYRVFCKSNKSGLVYAWNTVTGKICQSANQGETFTDLMNVPAAVWTMMVDDTNDRLYIGTSQAKVYESNGITASSTFSEITPATINPVAILLPSSMTIWNGWLWLGEYSNSQGELGSVQIFKYNLATKTWYVSKTFTNARHAHSFTAQGTAALYLTLGDADWGTGVGIHRVTTVNPTGEDTWTQWTGLNGNFTNHYPVDNLLTNLNGETILLGAGDRPKIHLTTAKISNAKVGSVNINARNFGFADSGAGETVRNVVLDDEMNCYYVTAETDKPRICVSPYPWTQSYILQELTGLNVLTTPITKSGQWIMFHTFRFHTVSFGANKAITVNKRNNLYNNGEINTFSSGTSGVQTSNMNKNSKSLFLEALCNQSGASQKTGYFTDGQVDLTKYKSLIVEGEYINCTGDNRIRVKVDTTTAIDGGVKEILPTNNDLYVTQPFSVKLDIATITGLHHVHVQAVATGLNAKSTIKVNRIFLSEI